MPLKALVRDSVANSGNAISIAVTTGTSPRIGDLLVVEHTNDYDTIGGMTAPTGTYTSGWVPWASGDDGLNNSHAKCWVHEVTQDGAHVVTTNQAVPSFQTVHAQTIYRHRGVDKGAGYNDTLDSATHNFNSIIAAEADEIVIVGASSKPVGNYTTPSTGLAKLTERDVDPFHTGAAFGRELTSAGSTGLMDCGFSVTQSSASSTALLIFGEAIPPANSTRRNLCKYPSAEVSTVGHGPVSTFSGATSTAVFRSNSITAFSGAYYYFANVTGTGLSDVSIRLPDAVVTAGQPYAFSLRALFTLAGLSTYLRVEWLNSSDGVISSANGSLTELATTNDWTQVSLLATAPAGAVRARLSFNAENLTDSTARSLRWDALLYEQATSIGPYFDGSTTDSGWVGVPHASESYSIARPAVQAAINFDVTSEFSADGRVVPQARINFDVTSEFTARAAVVARPRLDLPITADLSMRLGRVWHTAAVAFPMDADLSMRLGRVWHTAAVVFEVDSDLMLDGKQGSPPLGLNIITRKQRYVPASRRGRRYIAQDILTGEFLEWDLPLLDDKIKYVLNGSKTISGRLDPAAPDLAQLFRKNIQPRKTWIHAEENDQILASGILQPGSMEGQSLSIDAAGFTSYFHLVPYRSIFEGVDQDPADLIRHIVAHVQSYGSGDLNVIVDPTTTPVRIGEPERDVDFTTGAGEQVTFSAGPYKLNWWTDTNCGDEVADLAKEAALDYVEHDYWNADRSAIIHRLELGYPRVGVYKPHLSFVEDQNIFGAVPLGADPAMGCTEVHYTGAGEGRDMVHGSYVGIPTGGLRVPIVIDDPTITRNERAKAFAHDEYLRRQAIFGVGRVTVNTHHENAKLGTFKVGDDILVRSRIPWRGSIDIRHRIEGYDLDQNGQAVMELRPSSTYRYGAPPG